MALKFRGEGGAFAALYEDEETILSWKNVFGKKSKPVSPGKGENPSSTYSHAVWGTSNDDLPQKLQAEAEAHPLVSGIIKFKTQLQYSGGLSYGVRIVDENGKEQFKNISDGEIDKFLRKNNIPGYAFASLVDLNAFGMAFPQLIMSANDRDPKIVRLMNHTTRAKNCRVSIHNKQGDHDFVEVNMDMGTSDYNSDNSTNITALPEFDPVGFIKDKATKKQFIKILKVPDLGRANHMTPDWNSVREGGWLEISKLIAMFKKYLIENQASIKYHIEIDSDYWPSRFGREAWEALDTSEKVAKQQSELEVWAKFMKGTKGTGNMQVTTMLWCETKGVHRSLWKINELKGFISKDGVYIEDSREASENIMAAFNIHPDLLGNAPGTTLGSGSGSGNRVAYNQQLAMAKFIQDLTLSPLDIIADFNGWTDRIREEHNGELIFRFRNSLITTLDTGASATAVKADV
jgi:hypothetical protein